jgi:DNA-directed RNA polymerase subunit F
MRQVFVLEHLSKIAAVDPKPCRQAADEMLGLTQGRIANTLAKVPPTGKTDITPLLADELIAQSSPVVIFAAPRCPAKFFALR